MQVQLHSEALNVTINYSGAEVCSIKNKSGTEFIWQADKSVWARHAPVLFPIVGKLKDNQFVYEGQSYTMSQHGFARDREFTLISSHKNACVFQLVSNSESRKMYPFDFVFRIHYQLDGDTLTTAYHVVNSSPGSMLFSVGAHPGFNIDLTSGEKQEDLFLEFENQDYVLTGLHNGLRTDEKKKLKLKDNRLFLSLQLFDNDALVFENSQINQISLYSSKHKITLSCTGWPYFGIWSKSGAPFVCLEPWHGIADKLQSAQNLTGKDGMLCLAPADAFECQFSVTIH